MATLTKTAELTLIIAAQEGDEGASQKLLDAHEGLIRSVVKSFPTSGPIDTDDLLQEGRLGLWMAIMDFDVESGLRLSTIGKRKIIEFVGAAMAHSHPMSIPARTMRRYQEAWRDLDPEEYTEALLRATTGEHPMGADTFAAIHFVKTGAVYLDAEPDEEGLSPHETLAAPSYTPSNAGPALDELEALPPTQRLVVRLSVGLETGEPMIDSEIAAYLLAEHGVKVSRATVQRRRIEGLAAIAVRSL